jgi:hypothetical protein
MPKRTRLCAGAGTALVAATLLTVAAGHGRAGTLYAQATEPIANIGTLVCVVDPSDKSPPGDEKRLTCNFDPLTGPKARFVGTVKRSGADDVPDAKLVLAWSVMAPKVGTPAEQLQGRYLGTLDPQRGTRAPALVGGVDQSIALRPMTDNVDPGSGDNPTVTVIELQLSGMAA